LIPPKEYLSRFEFYGYRSFDIVSDFEIRISDFAQSKYDVVRIALVQIANLVLSGTLWQWNQKDFCEHEIYHRGGDDRYGQRN